MSLQGASAQADSRHHVLTTSKGRVQQLQEATESMCVNKQQQLEEMESTEKAQLRVQERVSAVAAASQQKKPARQSYKRKMQTTSKPPPKQSKRAKRTARTTSGLQLNDAAGNVHDGCNVDMAEDSNSLGLASTSVAMPRLTLTQVNAAHEPGRQNIEEEDDADDLHKHSEPIVNTPIANFVPTNDVKLPMDWDMKEQQDSPLLPYNDMNYRSPSLFDRHTGQQSCCRQTPHSIPKLGNAQLQDSSFLADPTILPRNLLEDLQCQTDTPASHKSNKRRPFQCNICITTVAADTASVDQDVARNLLTMRHGCHDLVVTTIDTGEEEEETTSLYGKLLTIVSDLDTTYNQDMADLDEESCGDDDEDTVADPLAARPDFINTRSADQVAAYRQMEAYLATLAPQQLKTPFPYIIHDTSCGEYYICNLCRRQR
jgi:hypothetical protein